MSETSIQCGICSVILDHEWVQIIVKDDSGYTVGFLCHEHLLDYAARVGIEQIQIDEEEKDE